jgi:small-conductance mechanosensitive channel
MAFALSASSFAQRPSQELGSNEAQTATAPGTSSETNGAPVEIDGRPISLVQTSVGGLSLEERAEKIQQRILNIAKRNDIRVEDIGIADRGVWTDILAGSDVIMGITEDDAKAARRPRAQLTAEYAEIIRRTVATYRQEHTWRSVVRGVIASLIATGGFVLSILLLLRVRRVTRNRLGIWVRKSEDGYSPKSVLSRLARYLVLPLLGTGVIVVLLAVLALLQFYVAFVLHSFPSTRYTSIRMNRWTLSELAGLGNAIWAYIPNLVIVIVILVAALYLVRLDNFIFREIQENRLTLRGFYPDWGAPTAKLVRLLILSATAVVIFPYLPGSNSPAFRGISVFLGVLLSLGSTSAVSHGVAGTILTYMRSFNVGDFVKIGDTVGEVVERNLLVTRICTQKKEIVTIPNGSVLGGVVLNYSAEAHKNGVIFHTTVSIGYNCPWKKVHELLINAALSTHDVLKSPHPFVLQSNLQDFYVLYELNAFTSQPQNMQTIYSDLHQNIQDQFNEAGVEINSPHYTSLRDGNRIAIPDEYIPKSYKEPSFGIRDAKDPEAFRGGPRERVNSNVQPTRS